MKQQAVLIYILIFTAYSFIGCQKLDIEKDTPKCIERLIEKFDKEESCDNGVKVDKYSFQGETVYVFDPGMCGADMAAKVMDSECNNFGYLGGITGNTIINGEKFSDAVFISVTWER